MRRTIGSPATGIAGLARTSVSGRRRVPSPAVSSRARAAARAISFPRTACRSARRRAARSRRGTASRYDDDDVVALGRGRAPRRRRECRRRRLRSRRTCRRGVSSMAIDHVAERELLAVFLVAEPDLEAELLEDVRDRVGVADHRFEFLAQLHRRRLHRSFEGEKAGGPPRRGPAARSRGASASRRACRAARLPAGAGRAAASRRAPSTASRAAPACRTAA